MSFKYKTISDIDVSRIYSDIENHKKNNTNQLWPLFKRDLPSGWSIDVEKDEYLYLIPFSDVRTCGTHFHFFSQGYIYQVVQIAFLVQEFSFQFLPDEMQIKRREIENRVLEALIVSKDYRTITDNGKDLDSFTDEQKKMRLPKFVKDDFDYDSGF